MCTRARLSNEESNVLLDLVKAEVRCSKAGSKPSISCIGTLVSFIRTGGSSHTLAPITYIGTVQDAARALVEWTWWRVLHCQFETNLSLAVDSVRLWFGFQAIRVVVDGDRWLSALSCCASEGCRTAKLSFTYDAVQASSVSMLLAARDRPIAFMYNAVQTPSASMWWAARDNRSSVTPPLTHGMGINSQNASGVQAKK